MVPGETRNRRPGAEPRLGGGLGEHPAGNADDEAILDKSFADSNRVEIGGRLSLLGQTGRRGSYKVVGAVKDNADLPASPSSPRTP